MSGSLVRRMPSTTRVVIFFAHVAVLSRVHRPRNRIPVRRMWPGYSSTETSVAATMRLLLCHGPPANLPGHSLPDLPVCGASGVRHPEDMENELVALSNELAGAVEHASRAVVAVNARPRFASSGVIWRPGIVVTAEHAIRRRDEIGITLPDGRTTSATLAGRDAGTDLAVLRLAEKGEPAATFSAAETLKPGQVILAIGRSPDSGVNATMGIVSAVSGSWRATRRSSLPIRRGAAACRRRCGAPRRWRWRLSRLR